MARGTSAAQHMSSLPNGAECEVPAEVTPGSAGDQRETRRIQYLRRPSINARRSSMLPYGLQKAIDLAFESFIEIMSASEHA